MCYKTVYMGGLSNIVVQFPYAGLFLMPLLGCIGFPFPEDAILLSCGFLISQSIVIPLPALLVVYAGVMISDFIIYSLGKKYGRAVITHRRFKNLLPPEKLHSLESRFRKYGVLSIVIGRQIIGVRAQTLLVAGVLDMPLRTFLMTDAFASSVTVMLMTTLGYTGTQRLIKDHAISINGICLLMVPVLLAALIFCLIKRHRSRRTTNNSENILAIEKMGC